METKTQRRIGKMIVSEKFYNEIIEETKRELRDINQDMLVNFGQDILDYSE